MNTLVAFWQVHFPVLSILLPAFTGFLLILLGNPGAGPLQSDWRQPIRHAISWGSAILGLILAICMLEFASSGQIRGYTLGEWSAPFGIVLVVDRLSAMMVMLTYVLALPILWYASAKWDQRGRYFHAIFHFLLMGLCGAFLTGDLFNLFVFFEVLLISSYVLLLHDHSKFRFKMGVHYVIINLLASGLFLIGLGIIYANVGSLNMADIARIFPTLPTAEHQMALTGAAILFIVFGIKAAMLPVGFWLPKTYAAAATPVAAIFAIMTKVGIYAILRVHGTIFSDTGGQAFIQQWLLPIGIITSLYGVLAAFGVERFRRFIGFMVLSSIGTILIAIALFTIPAWAAGLYYLVHSTIIAASFYLIAEWISAQRGEYKDYLKRAPRMKQSTWLGGLFFIMALMMAGLPPFSGFIGKVLLLQGTLQSPWQVSVILIVLLVSIFSILAFMRVGFILFWRAKTPETDLKSEEYIEYQLLPERPTPRVNIVLYAFLLILTAYAACAEPVYRYTYATAAQLKDKALYQNTLLKQDATNRVISVEPYDPNYLPELKYGSSQTDQYEHYIPYIISPETLAGEHIPADKAQAKEPPQQPTVEPIDGEYLVPVE